jgi:hypothetical protein
MKISIYLWLYSPLLDFGRLFSIFIIYTVGRTPWTRDQAVANPLPMHRTAQKQNKRTQSSMPQVGFEPRIPVFQQAERVNALDLAATVIVMKRSIYWDKTRCSPLKVHGRFREKYRLLQVPSRAMLATCFKLVSSLAYS